jgi:predicted GTPase
MTDKISTITTIIKYFFITIYTVIIFIFVLHWKYYKWLINQLKKGFFAIKLPMIINFLDQKNKDSELND